MSNFLDKNNKFIQDYAANIIPGISGLLGKRPEMYLPGGQWPTYYSKAKGIQIWDLQGNEYLDFTMLGVGSCALGYADDDINKVAKHIIDTGSLTTLNPPEDIELAELLLEAHPWAEQVKYARSGGEIMSMAVRLARAATGRDKILICGYHGWHDWYLSANLSSKENLNSHLLQGLKPLGVPKALADTVIPFRFNSCDDFKNIVEKSASDCAAIIIEPARSSIVCKKFLQGLRRVADKYKCILIFDEITCGWRHNTSGIHMELGVSPDLAAFGKTMANGIPMAALIGKKNVMQKSLETFISSTNWTERLGPACSVAFLKKHKKMNLGNILINNGLKIRKIWEQAALSSNLKIEISGIFPLSSFKIMHDKWPIIITFFIQEMLKKRILASDRCYSNSCQSEKYLNIYNQSCNDVFFNISKFLKEDNLESKLEGPIKQMGFYRLT